MGSSQLPDFNSLFQSTREPLVTDDTTPTGKKPAPPAKGNALPDFGEVFATPQQKGLGERYMDFVRSTKTAGLDEFDKAISDTFDSLGVKTGALRGLLNVIPSAMSAVMRTTPEDAMTAVSGGTGMLGEMVTGVMEHPVDKTIELGKAAIEGIVKPFIQYPLELLVDKEISMSDDLTKLGDNRALTPEEREVKAKSIGANVIGWMLGLKAEEMVMTKMIGQKAIVGGAGLKSISEAITTASKAGILGAERAATDVVAEAFGTITPRQALQLSEAVIAPQFLRNTVAGSIGGAAGGFATGYLEGNTSAERLQAGLGYALMAMPIGVAMSTGGAMLRFGKPAAGGMPEMISHQAGQIAKLRELALASNQTPAQMLMNMDNLAQTQSFAATLALKQLEYKSLGIDRHGTTIEYGKHAGIIPSVENPAEILQLVAEHNKESLKADGVLAAQSVVHVRKDGLHDVLIAPRDIPKNEQKFFETTGFVHGQQVGYGGRDHWVIESQGVPEGKRQYRLNLRDLVTNEKIADVMPKDIVKLTSREPGDLALHLGRLITESDIFDPAQGFQSQGKNQVVKDGGKNIHDWHEEAQMAIYDATGKTIVHKEGKAYLDGKELAPGLHHIEIVGAEHPEFQSSPDALPQEATMKRGAFVYIGGAIDEILVPNNVGDPVKELVQVGDSGTVVAFLDWDERPAYKGQLSKGSNNFFSFEDAPNRALATEAIKRARIEAGIVRSHSSLSTGGGKALMNAINFYGRDRAVRGRLTTYTPEVIKTHLIEDFLDHVGVTPDGNFLITPDENIAYMGFVQEALQPGKKGQELIAHAGEARETILGRLSNWRLKAIKGETAARMFTETKRALTLDEARQLLRQQMTENSIPTLRKEFDRAIDRSEMSFNDLTSSFMAMQGIRPEAGPAVRSFLEREIAQSLLGQPSARARLVDRTSIPILKGEVARAQATINRLTKQIEEDLSFDTATNRDTPNNTHIVQREKIANALQTVEVFEARVKQLENAEPLPFTVEEREVYSRLVTEAQTQRGADAKDLVATAHSNGFSVEIEEGGAIRLRDVDTWQRVSAKFSGADQARDFINATGRANGLDLDAGGNNMIPPSSVAGHMTPPGDQPRLFEMPHEFAPDSRVSKIMTLMDTVAPWFTPKRAFMNAIDNTFGTKLYADVYLPLQIAKMKLEATKRPFMNVAKEIEDVLLKGKIDRERWKTITHYRDSMSPQEVVDGYLSDRKLTGAEVTYAQKLVDHDIDIQKVYSYSRSVDEMQRQMEKEVADLKRQASATQDPASQQQFAQAIQEAQQRHAVDIESARDAFVMDDKHMEALEMFREIKKRPGSEAQLDAVARLARSLQNGEKSRDGFAAENNMSGAEIEAARKLDALYSSIAKANQVDERITNFFNHFRNYTDMPEVSSGRARSAAMRGSLDEMPKVASELIKSGQINVYETDPIRGVVQYINATFGHTQFNDTWKTAQGAAKEHLKRIDKGREAAAKVVNEYVNGMKGSSSPADQLAQTAMNHFMDAIGSDLQPQIRADMVDTFLAAGSGAMLGFRPAQGVRDIVQFAKIYYSRFGSKRFNNGMKLAFQRDADGVRMIEKLAEEGTVPGLSALAFASEQELADGLAGGAGRVKNAIFKSAEVGLKLSGQHNAYALAHAIAYLDTRNLAQNVLLDLSRGKINKEVAYKRLSMNSYDLNVAQDFDTYVTAGKFDEAADRLAHATGTETAFIFGLQNHPFGWGTNVGKVASQFGTWSVWTRNYLHRLAGRGTPGERAAAMARFATAEVATGLAGRTLGFNMRSWYMAPGIVFMGGPVFDYIQQIEDMAGMRGKMRQTLATSQLKRGSVPIVSNLIPGASAFSDYFQAWQLSQKRYGPVAVLGKGLGFSIDRSQRSFLDVLMENRPVLSEP